MLYFHPELPNLLTPMKKSGMQVQKMKKIKGYLIPEHNFGPWFWMEA
jgi:hypothetical protein